MAIRVRHRSGSHGAVMTSADSDDTGYLVVMAPPDSIARRFGGDNPEDGARWPNGFVLEQSLHVLASGNAWDTFAGEKFPEQHQNNFTYKV